MDIHSRAAPIPPEPFVLVVGPAWQAAGDDEVVRQLRRMGLQPEAAPVDAPAIDGTEGPLWRLRLGELSLYAARGALGPHPRIDPTQPATSLLGTSLPPGWSAGGRCWMVRTAVSDGAAADDWSVNLPALLAMLVLLIDAFEASHILWSPARLWTDAGQFRGAIAEMRSSGMPPVLHLVAFRHRRGTDGVADGGSVVTRGLAAFAEQELEAPIPPGWDMAGMVKRLARLAVDIMINGPMTKAQHVPGLHSGEWVALTPRAAAGGKPATLLVEFSSGG